MPPDANEIHAVKPDAQAAPALQMPGAINVAYLINQYPGISHSFVRREIQALERAGARIHRFAIRASRAGLISAEDKAEEKLTRMIVGPVASEGAAALAGAIFSSLFSRPARSAAAFAKAMGMGWRSEAGLIRHVFYFAEALALAAWLRRAGLTHIHAHFGTNSATVAMLAAHINDGSFSMTVHGPEEFDKPALVSLRQKIEAAAFTAGVSSFGASQLKRLVAPAFWGRIKIVHCGIEKDFYESASNEGAAATRSPDRFVSVGRLCEQKGQITLIEAAGLLKIEGRKFEIVLVGDGEMRAEIEAAARAHNVREEIIITGWKTPGQVRAAIESARAFVLPSFAEGLPVSIMEAFCLERPVISTYIAGIPELVLPGVNGWLTPAGDAVALAGAMTQALDASDSEIAAMGRAGKARVIERHDIDEIAAQLTALFARLPGARQQKSPQ